MHEGKLPDGRTVLRGTLGSVRVAVAQASPRQSCVAGSMQPNIAAATRRLLVFDNSCAQVAKTVFRLGNGRINKSGRSMGQAIIGSSLAAAFHLPLCYQTL
jgi:hypothetical protein